MCDTIKNLEDKPIVWRNIEKVPFARWNDFIEKKNEETR